MKPSPFTRLAATFVVLCLIVSCKKQDAENTLSYEELKAGFQTPSGTALPKVYWWWLNGYTDSTRIVAELRSMKEAGIGGVDIFEIGIQPASDPGKIIPAGPAFMSDSSVQAIRLAVEEAGRLGMEVGLGLASSWNAGGSWVKPEHAAKTIYYNRAAYRPDTEGNFLVPFPEITPDRNGNPRRIQYRADGRPAYWEDIAVLAVPVSARQTGDTSAIITLNDHFDPVSGMLTWKPPGGEWDIYRYICSNSGEELIRPSPNSAGPIIDHFDSTATSMHINYFIEKLKPALGGDFAGSALKYFYLASYEAKEFAWTSSLPAAFRQLHGYDIYKFLPAVFNPTFFPEEVADQFAYDFSSTFSELMIRNHYRKAKEICNRHGLQIISEAGGPGHMHHIPVETLKALGSLDIPRGEFWYNRTYFKEDSIVDYIWLVKEIAAASHIYRRGIVEEEAFTSYWDWQEGPGDLKTIADRAFCEGMNRLVIHGFSHNPPEFGAPGIVYWAGTHYNDRQVWWPKIKPFNEYLARISYILQNSRFVADVLYYYGDDIPNLVPPKNTRFKAGDGYDYEIINTEILLNDLTVEDGEWVLPGIGRYKVLSLGKGHRANPEATKKIEALRQKGGIVADGDISRSLNIPPDFTYNAHADSVLDYIHYRSGHTDFYLIRNTTGEQVSRYCSFRQTGKSPEIWDPTTGQVYPVSVWETSGAQTQIPLTFPPKGTYFVAFSDNTPAPHFDRLLSSDSLLPAIAYTKEGMLLPDSGAYRLMKGNETVSHNQAPVSQNIDGPWEVTFDQGKQFGAVFPELASWTGSPDQRIRYYSGIAAYTTEFEAPARTDVTRVLLDLGAVAEVADVWLNDHHLGISWCQPHRFDITSVLKPGKNMLRVEIANTWSNRLTGDGITGEKFTRTNLVKANKNLVLWKDLPLKESGLLGPVKLTTLKNVTF